MGKRHKVTNVTNFIAPQIFLSWYGYVRLCIYMYITVVMGAVKIIKYIRNRVLHLRVFEALCERMGYNIIISFFYAEVIRFWRGRVLSRLFDLKKVKNFLRE